MGERYNSGLKRWVTHPVFLALSIAILAVLVAVSQRPPTAPG